MKKNKLLIAIGTVLLIGIASLLFYKTKVKLNSDGLIHIGAILSLTGQTSYFGEETKDGIKAALALLKDEGVTNIVVHFEDSAFSTKVGLTAFNRICCRKELDGVIVAHSVIAQPIASLISQTPEAEQARYPVVMTALAFSTALTKGNKVCVRCFPSGEDEGHAMANFIHNNMSNVCNKIVVVYPNDDYGIDASRAFARQFSDLGGSIIYNAPYDAETINQTSFAQKLIAYKPDGVYMIGASPAFSNLLKALRVSGFSNKIFAGAGMDVGNVRKAIGDSAVADVIFTSVFSDSRELMNNERYCQYKEKLANLGRRPTMLNVYTAIAFMSLYEVIRDMPSGSSIERASSFCGTKQRSILGDIWYDLERGIKAPLFIKRTVSTDMDDDELICVMK